ncbi:MAG: T9SS type A sorting domain-containing protein [Tannerella sp.]|nr:T9SS type A sorting domain-containing protein [Tannerella sp.]
MNKLILLLSVMMLLSATSFTQKGRVRKTLAGGQVYLPTTVYRVLADGSRQKIEYTYNEFGHTVSEKWSVEQNGTYVVNREIIRTYHRLPNGEFVLLLEEGNMFWLEGMKGRHSFVYDEKGMELLDRYETYESGEWKVYRSREAVLNENGIRTAIRTFNIKTREMEVDPNYTFDKRGRTTQATDYGNTYTYTWDDNDRLTGFTSSQEGRFHNMEITVNEEYFNPYMLNPLLDRSRPVEDDYAWNDYTLHEWLFSADGERMTVRAIEDKTNGEATQSVFVGDVEMIKTVYKKDVNGGYSVTTTELSEGGTYTYEQRRIYNEYGAVIRDYNMENDTGNGYHRESLWVYERTCDAEGRPVRTTNVYNGETQYTETYDSWSVVTPLGTEALPALPTVRVYPNPAVDVIVIDGAPAGSTLAVFDLSGRIIFRRANIGDREIVSVASWSGGLYLVAVQTQNGTVTNKIVKK